MFSNIYAGKKVFLTGHTGFKGSWLAVWLKSLGAEVYGYSLYVPSEPSHFHFIKDEVFAKSYEGDVRDFENLKTALTETKPDIAFHLAAMPIVSECYQKPRESFETNLMGTVNLLEAMRFVKEVKAGVFITSDKCYENVEWFYGYREDDTLGGSDPYSASKACAEIAISSMTRSFMTEEGFRISSARAGNVIGGGDWALNRIIPDIVRKWNNGEELLMRNPNSTRPWQHVLEPLSGYLALGEHLLKGSDEVTGEAFNFGPRDNTDISVGEVVKSMNQYIDGKWAIEKNVTMKKEAGLLKLNCDKAKTFLDWSSTMDYEKTIEFTALWYKEFYNNKTPKMLDFTNKQITEYCDIAKSLKLTWAL